MGTLSIQCSTAAVSAMQALQDVLLEELAQIELSIQQLAPASQEQGGSVEEREAYIKARAALHGGMASITDVLGWVRLMAEKDVDGNEYASVTSLPHVPVSSIN